MINYRLVTDSSCNSCGGTKRVVEFKIGRGTTEHVVNGGGLLVRLCYDCRRSLGHRIADDDDLSLLVDDYLAKHEAAVTAGHHRELALFIAAHNARAAAFRALRDARKPREGHAVVDYGYTHRSVSPWDQRLVPIRKPKAATRKKSATTRKKGIGARGSKARTKR